VNAAPKPGVEQVLDELTTPKKSPAPAEKPPAERRALAPAEVIDGLIESGRQRGLDNRREALATYEQAQAAAKAGKRAEAIKLARKAARLSPDNAEITGYALQLEQQGSEGRWAASNQARALAHMAAALSRAQQLQQQGKYRVAEELLDAVVKAADLFKEADAGFYRELAQRELVRYRAAVDAHKILPESTEKPAEEPKLVATTAMPPVNYRRLLTASESQVPAWYAQHKVKLATPMTVDYRGEPVALVLEDIGRATGLSLTIDLPVTLSRQHLNAMIDLRTAETPAETILDLACQKSALEYVIMERAVVVTSPAKAIAYLRQLPEGLRNNWAAARVLFPELSADLLAAPAAQRPAPATAIEDTVPSYLRSGKALLDDVRTLLESPTAKQ
jgi:tetratricopeptide (TPR) repeat protein